MSMAASRPASEPLAVVVMGVSGCGKSSIGARLAGRLDGAFIEGDALHPPANIAKMSAGTPLTDADRLPWLDLIVAEIKRRLVAGQSVVASCSALKTIYRDRLRAAAPGQVRFVFLRGDQALLQARMSMRPGHFMPASLLTSQLATLEDPSGEDGVSTFDIALAPEEIVVRALQEIMHPAP
jgi:gluconokinase